MRARIACLLIAAAFLPPINSGNRQSTAPSVCGEATVVSFCDAPGVTEDAERAYIQSSPVERFAAEYDYRIKVAEAQRPWLLGAALLALAVLAMILAMFYKSRTMGKRLVKLVAEKTSTLTAIFKAAEEEAMSASNAKSRFIANMSHEMRTPMNVIVGLTDLMLEDDGTPCYLRDTLKKVSTAGDTLMELINNVLDISKIEAGKLELMPVQYGTASLINDIATLNMIRIEDKPVTFTLDIEETMPSMMVGDDLRVKQVLNNLLSNAFKYTKEGSVTLSVSASVDCGNVWVTFRIIDTGIGIREEDIARLFTDYNQVDALANREIEGTGLGLSITKKIVEQMDGTITVESAHGKGTMFCVTIRQTFVTEKPIGKEAADNLRSFRYADRKKRPHEMLSRPNLSYAKVLVVDDFPTNLDVAAGMLRKYKMQVDCVTSGKEAVARMVAAETHYDAIFMDHMMPEMDGIEATEAIRALGTEYAEEVPIIALTANAVAGNEKLFLERGFNAFLPKPINVTILDAVVQRWVRNKSKEAAMQ